MTVDLRLETIRGILAEYAHERVDHAAVSRQAAVATILRGHGDDAEVLLIRRAERPGDPWSGQMAFPGGHVEPGERKTEAARRETREEIGLDLDAHGRLIGRLDHTHAVARGRRVDLLIAPYVFELTGEPSGYVLNHEVAEVVWAPLRPLLLGHAHTIFEYEFEGELRRFPGYDLDGRVVWGLTYRMLGNLFALLHPDWEPIDF